MEKPYYKIQILGDVVPNLHLLPDIIKCDYDITTDLTSIYLTSNKYDYTEIVKYKFRRIHSGIKKDEISVKRLC